MWLYVSTESCLIFNFLLINDLPSLLKQDLSIEFWQKPPWMMYTVSFNWSFGLSIVYWTYFTSWVNLMNLLSVGNIDINGAVVFKGPWAGLVQDAVQTYWFDHRPQLHFSSLVTLVSHLQQIQWKKVPLKPRCDSIIAPQQQQEHWNRACRVGFKGPNNWDH